MRKLRTALHKVGDRLALQLWNWESLILGEAKWDQTVAEPIVCTTEAATQNSLVGVQHYDGEVGA